MRTIIVTILLLILSACGGGQTTDNIDDLYNSDQYACREYAVYWASDYSSPQAVIMAAQYWNARLGEQRFVIVNESPSPFADVNSSRVAIQVVQVENLTKGDEDDEAYADPLEDYGVCSCRIEVLPHAADRFLLLAHELGHCQGLRHSEEDGSIMEAFVDAGAQITETSISLVHENTNPNDPPQPL